MADGITLSTNIGSGAAIKTDDDGTFHWQLVKVAFGGNNTQTEVTSSVGLPVSDAGGSLTVDNAGTFATQVDGAALTSLQLIDNYVYIDDADWTATTSSHALIGGVYQSTPGTITDGDTGPIRLDANGAIHINDGGNSITVDGTVTANLSATDNAVLDQIEVNTSYGDSVGSGTEAAALRVTIANNSTGLLSIDDNGGSLTVDNGGTFATQSTLQAGTAAFGKLSANSGVDIGDVDVTSISAGTSLVGDVGLSGARTSGGTTLYKNIDVDESEDQVKATAGQIYWIHAINLNAAVRYPKIYNATAATVVVGTTVPDLTFPIPANSTTGAGFVIPIPNGIAFSTAITIAATTGVADADSGAPGANEVIVNLGYA